MGGCIRFLTIIVLPIAVTSLAVLFLFTFSNDITVYTNDIGQYSSGMFMGCVYGKMKHCSDTDVYMKYASFTKSLKDNYSPETYTREVEDMISIVNTLDKLVDSYETDQEQPAEVAENKDKIDKITDWLLNKYSAKVNSTTLDISRSEDDIKELVKQAKEKIKDIFKSKESFKKAFKDGVNSIKSIFDEKRVLTPLQFTHPSFSFGSLTFAKVYSFTDGSKIIVAARFLSILACIFIFLSIISFIIRLFTNKFKILNHVSVLALLSSSIAVAIVGYFHLIDRANSTFKEKVSSGLGLHLGIISVVLNVFTFINFVLMDCM